jgi:hypothetical protein
MAQPILTQSYVKDVTMAQQYEGVENKEVETQGIECIVDKRPIIGNDRNIWRTMFPADATEVIFDTTKFCSYYVMISILQKHIKRTFSIANMKLALWNAYEPFMERYKAKVIHILKKQGKAVMMDKVRTNLITFHDLIMSEDYYITNLDIWMLASKLALPIILFSTMKLSNLGLSANWIITGGERSAAFYFIRSPPISATVKEQVPEYHLVSTPYTLSQVKGLKNMVDSDSPDYVENVQSLETYMHNYKHLKM